MPEVEEVLVWSTRNVRVRTRALVQHGVCSYASISRVLVRVHMQKHEAHTSTGLVIALVLVLVQGSINFTIIPTCDVGLVRRPNLNHTSTGRLKTRVSEVD